jgi:hypothetical protein
MRPFSLFAALLVALAFAFGQDRAPANTSAAPGSTEASLSRDRHEGLNVSVDPYTDTERAKKKFGKANPLSAGILPLEVSLRNELDQPIRIDLSTVQLEVRPPESKRQDIDSLSAAEVAKLIVHPEGSKTPSTRRFPPIGIPSSGDKKVDDMADILRPLALDADIVPPMGMIHGFLFFNLSHEMTLAENASLYMPNAMLVPSNKALMFFEVSLRTTSER